MFAGSALVLLLAHLSLLGLPFHWDELGQFIPAALDIYQAGAWIPQSTTPNAHPPGVLAYLAAVWSIAGYSIPVTRVAMLLLGSAGLLATLLLAAEFLSGAAAWIPTGLLCLSPLFFAQSMMAQLDMPAMLFTCLAAFFFFRDRPAASAVASTALVLVKETSLIVPLVLGAELWRENRRRQAAYFLLPGAVLGIWFAVLVRATGHMFGDAEFTRYNLYYPLNPARMAFALVRRLYFVLFANFQWIGVLAIFLAWRRDKIFQGRSWKILGLLIAAHVILFTALGGAVLERYLLPILPLLYIAMTAAWSACPRVVRIVSPITLAAGLVIGNFWNPPYPFSLDNNLAFVDFVRLHETTAKFLEQQLAGKQIVTAWPLTAALRRPELGYVRRRVPTRELADFAVPADAIDWNSTEFFVLYSRMWDPWGVMASRPMRGFLKRFMHYQPQISSQDLLRHGLRRIVRWERRGQWAEVWHKDCQWSSTQ